MTGKGRIGPSPGPTLGDGIGLDQLVAGVVVDDRYRIVRRLGQGGMAVVFEVVDEQLGGARRALKVLDPKLTGDRGAAADESLVTRFKQEVTLGQEKLFHPNIVRVHAYGRVGQGPETLHYAVLELVTGETLHDWLNGQKAVTAQTRWALLSQLAGMLAFAHEQGVVHRDVKPSNIFVETAVGSGDEVRLRLGDFGIARVLGEATVATPSGDRPRTIFHCAPEQMMGGEVGTHTDVYLFGLVAYWLIYEGARMWDPTHSDNPFPDAVGLDLADLVRQCLRSNGKDRPPHGGSLVRLLKAAQRGADAARVKPEPEGAVAGGGPAESPGSATEEGSGGRRPKRVISWPRLVGFGAALVLAALVLGILIGRDRSGGGSSQVVEGPKIHQPAPSTPTRTATPGPRAGDLRIDQPLGMRFRYIPAGRFRMGSPADEEGRYDDEEPQHEVEISEGFWMGESEVTQGQWRRLMGTNPSRFSRCGDECPAEQVNWYEALAFANKLSRRAGFEVCYRLSGCNGEPGEGMECTASAFVGVGCGGYRLPTEAEWEFAARAGTTTRFYWGDSDGEREMKRYVWYKKNAYNKTWTEPHAQRVGPQPVWQKMANRWQLYDMLGNVHEWVWDLGAPYSEQLQTDPVGQTEDDRRVLRGGSWFDGGRDCRSACRGSSAPGYRDGHIGLRVARGQGAQGRSREK